MYFLLYYGQIILYLVNISHYIYYFLMEYWYSFKTIYTILWPIFFDIGNITLLKAYIVLV